MTAVSPRRRANAILELIVCAAIGAGCAMRAQPLPGTSEAERRRDVIARAQVWEPRRVAELDLRAGPDEAGAIAPNTLVECTFDERDYDGATPKFGCRLKSGEVVKVKYGRDNGEVYAEVAATRLLWALGFGADHMYPVRVRCHGCPPDPKDTASGPPGVRLFEAAAIERKMRGRPYDGPGGDTWEWAELDVPPRPGGASIAQRDALKLLAAMLQHTDSKPDQQRLVCLEADATPGLCRQPFMYIADVGKTFGKANLLNRDQPGSVNLAAWSETKVWRDDRGCRARLSASLTGTLADPVITDEGRRFLADRLMELTDRQLRALFTMARFPMREGPGEERDTPEVDAWVTAFKDKVAQITERSCLRAAERP
jgi:hypothetical protein